MKVIVQQLGRKHYLDSDGNWNVAERAEQFQDPITALAFCLRKNFRDVRLVGRDAQTGNESYIYPFGGDPAVKRERKNLRKAIRENRRLKTHRRVIAARIDALMAEGKEARKQFPFKPLKHG